ncbi:MAG TPA: hypothetical protein VG722_03910 [Tepidisphaeraceae bacterium]|nr:hypothetical protein [Tepidisphaeraceae bacterium]
MKPSASHLATLCVLSLSTLAFVGCASNGHNDIPASARMLNDAHGSITVTAPERGTVYVYDKTDNELVYSGKVRRDDVIHLNEHSGNIDINDRKVAGKALIGDHEHEVYFDPANGAQTATYVEPGDNTTVITPSNGHTTVVTPSDSD